MPARPWGTWCVIHSTTLLGMLAAAAAGEDPDMIILEFYTSSDPAIEADA